MALTPTPRQGDVWWAQLDPIRGSEIAKTRPVLILSVDQINHSPAGLSICVPLTTTPHTTRVRIELPTGDRGQTRVSHADALQVRSLSHDRLTERIARAPDDACSEVARRLALFTRHDAGG
ncbi:MAG: type II toxin-antitoxin system PemK/MazF family toxin [Solirubrobacteraceae bacterium]